MVIKIEQIRINRLKPKDCPMCKEKQNITEDEGIMYPRKTVQLQYLYFCNTCCYSENCENNNI